MRATSLSINLRQLCNASCPFCISRTTCKPGKGDEKRNVRLMRGLERALNFAHHHRIGSVIVTSSGEPLLNPAPVRRVIRAARRFVPVVELQTNGSLLDKDFPEECQDGKKDSILDALVGVEGLCPDMDNRPTHIAISASAMSPRESAMIMGLPGSYDYVETATKVAAAGIICRVTLNMIKGAFHPSVLPEYADSLYRVGVRQLTLRELGVDESRNDSGASSRIKEWVTKNALGSLDVGQVRDHIDSEGRMAYKLPHGPWVYSYRGLAVTVATCGVNETFDGDVRSLVLQPDGHVHPGWVECAIL